MSKADYELPIILRESCRLVDEGQLRLSRKKEEVEENKKALERFLTGQCRKPASWGMSLCEREAEKEKERTMLTKAKKEPMCLKRGWNSFVKRSRERGKGGVTP